jgi:hypothetical protein
MLRGRLRHLHAGVRLVPRDGGAVLTYRDDCDVGHLLITPSWGGCCRVGPPAAWGLEATALKRATEARARAAA